MQKSCLKINLKYLKTKKKVTWYPFTDKKKVMNTKVTDQKI